MTIPVRLPNRSPDRMWGGPGGGQDCAICSVAIKHDELEFELEFARSRTGSGPDEYHVHLHCFEAWELERNNAEASPADGESP